jgi:hypothetical protein
MAVGGIASVATLAGAFFFAASIGGLGVLIVVFLVDETLQKPGKSV